MGSYLQKSDIGQVGHRGVEAVVEKFLCQHTVVALAPAPKTIFTELHKLPTKNITSQMHF
jgi:hypothetical protein